jgi:diguanylate cyclase (GGDEF)-like protein
MNLIMMKRVILLNDRHSAPTPELLETLRAAGITTVIAGREHDWSVEEKLPPIATLYEIGKGSTLSEVHVVIADATSMWPEVPLIACRRNHQDRYLGTSILDNTTLKRLGFRFIADDPAQLPILLRDLETDTSINDNHAMDDMPVSMAEIAPLPDSIKRDDLLTAFEMVTLLLFASDQQKAAQTALMGLKTLISADHWTIYLVSDSTDGNIALEPLASLNSSKHSENLNGDNRRSNSNKSLIACPKSSLIYKAIANAEIIKKTVDKQRFIISPLTKGGRVLGVIEGTRPIASRPFSQSEAKLLWSISVPTACALANSVRIAEAERLSLTDDLTKLHNARYLRRYLVNELKRARRYNSPLALLFLDLDNFKSINDQYGHLVGSHVLMEIASAILTSVRDTDVVARYGGDEYVIILPETPIQQALSVAERIRERIATQAFTGGRHLQLSVTASFGVAAYPNHAASPQQLIASADMAMYKSKSSNKNCISVASVSDVEQE